MAAILNCADSRRILSSLTSSIHPPPLCSPVPLPSLISLRIKFNDDRVHGVLRELDIISNLQPFKTQVWGGEGGNESCDTVRKLQKTLIGLCTDIMLYRKCCLFVLPKFNLDYRIHIFILCFKSNQLSLFINIKTSSILRLKASSQWRS